ncbi:MAG: hypothetical protein KAJ05_02850 [Candidatus Latescibacteria bacterium]|nr:hypothetical protein [Candidatus Latescibacterota bacterium]
MQFFIAGIIQGSISELEIHSQDYRIRIREMLKKHFPEAEVFCPVEHHPNSLYYAFEKGQRTFFDLMERAGEADVLVAFLPEASMGTAIEMWEAFQRGRVVLAVTPLRENWVVKFLADAVLDSLEGLETFITSGELDVLIARKRAVSKDSGEKNGACGNWG